jgi:dCTP deaminase
MIKNDKWIIENAALGMIEPFVPESVRSIDNRKVISYGTSSFGYDIRLSPKDFRVFRHIPGTVIDPKNFNPDNLQSIELQRDDFGEYFIVPGHSYALGVAIEHLSIPNNITVICMGKSTYARCGIIANITPGEAGWKGHLTLEFSNSSAADARIYANEGVVQLLFLEGEQCETSYQDRNGKYQGQTETITLPKV